MGIGFRAFEDGTAGKESMKNMERLKKLAASMGLPPWILNTGDVAEIMDFMEEQSAKGQVLSPEAQRYLTRTVNTTLSVQEQADAHVPGAVNPERALQDDGTNLLLTGIHQTRGQTTSNGCWSCAYKLLLQSRGVHLEQEQIRDYRPVLTQEQIMTDGNPSATLTMNGNFINNIFEVGDIGLRVAPDAAMHELQLSVYSPDYGISREQYIANARKLVLDRVTDALRNEHSPVAFMMNNHYRTIVGLEVRDGKEYVLYKNSLDKRNPDATHAMSLDDLVKEGLTPSLFGSEGIVFNWFSDIRLSKDGRTLYGMPNNEVFMDQNGQVGLTTQDAIDLDESEKHSNHLEGVTVRQTLRQDLDLPELFGFAVSESVYLPKQLPVAYLQQEAAKRSAQDEAALKEKDTQTFAHKPVRARVPGRKEDPTNPPRVVDDYFRFVRKKPGSVAAPEKTPRRDQADAVDRSRQLKEYYLGLDESHRFDQLVSLRLMDARHELTDKEKLVADQLLTDFFVPRTVTGDYDIVKLSERNQLLFERKLAAQLEVARTAERIYSELDPAIPNRQDIADRMAMVSPAGILYEAINQLDTSMRLGTYELDNMLFSAGMDRTNIIDRDFEKAQTRFYAGLSKKDQALCDRGATLNDLKTKALPIDKLGIIRKDYDALHAANLEELTATADQNFLQDDTMYRAPKMLLDGTLCDEFSRDRMLDFFHTLDTKEEQLAFLQNVEMMAETPNGLDHHEKLQFHKAAREYFGVPEHASGEVLEEQIAQTPAAPGKAANAQEAAKAAAWRRPARAITEESLDKMVNLYDQMCGEDANRFLHGDSKAYKNLERAILEVKYLRDEQKRKQKTFTPEQLSDLMTMMDRVSDAAKIYLKDKSKARGTAMGQERYEIAMAALHVANAGAAKAMLAEHNRKRSDKKKVSLEELTGREGRTEREQHEHRHGKGKEKQAEPQQQKQ
ncbi:MAG: hypothetical protein K6G16_00640 [Lachnospiraceae bacterium]|nr:hypothetical protein [Lachnospiraceae bacterium]